MTKISRLFLHHSVLFHVAQRFICGNSWYLFPKRWNWRTCHTHRAFQLPFRTLNGKLRTFPTVKSKTMEFLHDLTQQYTPVHFGKSPRELLPEKEQLSGHHAAYFEVAGTCYTHDARDYTICALKIAGSAWQNDFKCYRPTSHITL